MSKVFLFYWENGYSKSSEGNDVHEAANNSKLASDPNGHPMFFEELKDGSNPRFEWNKETKKWVLTKKAIADLAAINT